MDWNQEQIDLLGNLLKDGLSRAEIGRVMGISRNSVAGACHRYYTESKREPDKPWSDEERTRLRELAPTMTCQQIAMEMGKNRHAIDRQLKKLGIKAKRAIFVFQRTSPRTAAELIVHRAEKRALPRMQLTREQLEPVTPLPFKCVPLLELGDNDCRYPHGEDVITFCGQPKHGESPYCEFHHALCFHRADVPNPMWRAA